MGTTEKRETLKTATDVLEHLLKNGRKIKKSKLYQDIRKGILRRNADLSFSVGNVNKYGTTLPMAETPEMVNVFCSISSCTAITSRAAG